MSGRGAPARIATPMPARPIVLRVSATTSPRLIASSINGGVRTTTRQASAGALAFRRQFLPHGARPVRAKHFDLGRARLAGPHQGDGKTRQPPSTDPHGILLRPVFLPSPAR